MGFLGSLAAYAIIKAVDYTVMGVTASSITKKEAAERKQKLDAATQANAQNRNLIVTDTFINQNMLVPSNGILLLTSQNNSKG